MIERGEWVRCDAALDLPRPIASGARTAAEVAATGDVRNLHRCERHLAFLDGNRQGGWALARSRGWTRIADARYPDVSRNLCPRHAHTPPAVLVLMPLRSDSARAVENVALALLDAATEGQALAVQLHVDATDTALRDRFAPEDLVELHARAQRHEALRRATQEPPRGR